MGRLTGCCCCFHNLRDGARAVGITLLVLGSLGLVLQVVGTANLLQQDKNARLTGGAVAHLVIPFAVSILYTIMSALLVHGVNNSRRGMILGWLIFTGIITGLQTAAVAIAVIVLCIYGIWSFLLPMLMLGVAVLIGVFWYWFVVVLHYYQEMNEQNGFVNGS